MRPGCMRRSAKVLAATGVLALVAGWPGAAHAATQYDGDATALRIEGLRLQLFPHGTQALPDELEHAVARLRAQAPEQMRRGSLALVVPDQVVGHARFPGADTQAAVPPNPLLTADVVEARSSRNDQGHLVSEAAVSGLSLAGGVLSADVVRTRCSGTGERMGLDVSELRLSSNEALVRNEIALEPGTRTRVPGLGTVTFNEQDTDGTTYAEATNVVVDLDSDLSLDALLRVFEATGELEAVLQQVFQDVADSRVGGEHLPPEVADGITEAIDQVLTPVAGGGDQAADQVVENTEQAEAVKSALNEIAHLEGTVTVADAACAQQTVAQPAPQPQQAVPAQPVAARPQPRLADTGSPAGLLGTGAAGLVAVSGGAYALARLRRRQA